MTNDKADINSQYNQAGSGFFQDNTSRSITPAFLRGFVAAVLGGFVNIFDNAFDGVKGFKHGVNTIAGLKAVTTTTLSTAVYITFRDTGNSDLLRTYELVSGTETESSPTVIRPTDHATTSNEKVWKLCYLGVSLPSGVEVFCGSCDLSTNTLPTTGGTGSGGSIITGNKFRNIANSTSLHGPDGGVIQAGVMLMAAIDSPTTIAHWILYDTRI